MEKRKKSEQKPTTDILLYPSPPLSIRMWKNEDCEQRVHGNPNDLEYASTLPHPARVMIKMHTQGPVRASPQSAH